MSSNTHLHCIQWLKHIFPPAAVIVNLFGNEFSSTTIVKLERRIAASNTQLNESTLIVRPACVFVVCLFFFYDGENTETSIIKNLVNETKKSKVLFVSFSQNSAQDSAQTPFSFGDPLVRRSQNHNLFRDKADSTLDPGKS